MKYKKPIPEYNPNDVYRLRRISEKYHILREYIINNWDDQSNFKERIEKAKEVIQMMDLKKENVKFINKQL